MWPSSPIEVFWAPAVVFLYVSGELTYTITGALLFSQLLVDYLLAWWRYHWVNKAARDGAEPQLPPSYPAFIPFIGIIPSIFWNLGAFVNRAAWYNGSLTSSRLWLLDHDFYTFHDRETVELMFKQSSLATPISIYRYSTKYLFGMREKAHSVYMADDSGPFPKPYPGTNVPSRNRIDYITHHGLLRGLTGPGLQPTTARYVKDVSRRLQKMNLGDTWTEMDDFPQFFRDIVGTATLQSILGPTMLRINPEFVQNLWDFDVAMPEFSKGYPKWILSREYQNRERLLQSFKNWYKYARENFDESQIDEDGDGDPVWGSSLIRHRQETVLQIDHQDDDALACVDLGLAWATIGNVVLSAAFASFHIFKDHELLRRVRDVIDGHVGNASVADVDSKDIAADPLLSSIYAETLRRYIKVYSAYMSAHEDVLLGKWWLPKGKMCITNSGPSHMDSTFWNDKGGVYPVQSFWADRFIVNPTDPSSGPTRPECRQSNTAPVHENMGDGIKPYFSLDGCEGSWIPYGGGHSICPGRFFAKNVITVTCALVAHNYDIEIHSDEIEFTTRRFGVGVEEVKNALPFRIRKRRRAM